MLLARALFAAVLLPGLFAGALPWVIAAYDSRRGEGHAAGAIIVAAGGVILFLTVRDFLVIGSGTLAPWDPPRKLVAVRLYRFVRNPMYVGVIVTIAGTAIFIGSPLVAVYAAIVAVAFHLRVVLYEEPVLARQFPEDWVAYSAKVSRWVPHWPRET